MGVFLGFDYGSEKTGIAVGETVTRTARPLAVLPTRSERFWLELDRLVERWQPKGLVVGIVGPENRIAREIEAFCRALQARYRLPLFKIEETFTSQAAEQLLKEREIRGEARRRLRDAVAAALILEDFLARFDERGAAPRGREPGGSKPGGA